MHRVPSPETYTRHKNDAGPISEAQGFPATTTPNSPTFGTLPLSPARLGRSRGCGSGRVYHSAHREVLNLPGIQGGVKRYSEKGTEEEGELALGLASLCLGPLALVIAGVEPGNSEPRFEVKPPVLWCAKRNDV